MAETTDQHMSAPPGEGWQWAFSYLRQDIQDLRGEIRDLRESLAELNRRIDRHFSWSMTAILAVGGILAALIKL